MASSQAVKRLRGWTGPPLLYLQGVIKIGKRASYTRPLLLYLLYPHHSKGKDFSHVPESYTFNAFEINH